MICETIEVRGVKLDVYHDGDVIHEVQTYNDQEDILPLLDACVVAELRAILFPKAEIVPAVYELLMDDSCTLAEVNARRGYAQGVTA